MNVLVVCAKRYNGHELWVTLGVLQSRGHTSEVVSTQTLISDEVTGQANTIKRTLDDVATLEGFDALVFVSGNMQDTEAHWKHPRTLAYVHEAIERNLPIAAICCSVPIVKEAVKGKRVSFFPLVRSREILRNAGAILQTVTISVDGKLVTAEHQMATQVWVEEFCNVLDGTESSLHLVDSGYKPKGRERKAIPELEHLRQIVRKTGRTDIDDTKPSKGT
jgi:putative intracellular protease/amidase